MNFLRPGCLAVYVLLQEQYRDNPLPPLLLLKTWGGEEDLENLAMIELSFPEQSSEA